MKKPQHAVTDHAVIRYLERVRGVDIEALRRRIGRKVDLALELEASAAVADGFCYRIVNGKVVSVSRQHSPPAGHGKSKARKGHADG